MGFDQFKSPEQAEEALLGKAVLVKMDESGEVEGVEFDKSASPVFNNLAQTIFAETILKLRKGEKSWSAEEENKNGVAQVEYQLIATDEELFSLVKTRDEYTRLNALEDNSELAKLDSDSGGSYQIKIARDGVLKSYIGEERIHVKKRPFGSLVDVETKIALSLESVSCLERDLEGVTFATGETHALHEVVVSEGAEDRALDQRIGDMTVEKMEDDLLRFAALGEMPELSKWIWQVTGLLTRDPEQCDRLIDVWNDEKIASGEAMKSVLEVLTLTGHGKAQSVLRELLATDKAKGSDNYYVLLQRLAKLEEPDEKSAEFAHEIFAGVMGHRETEQDEEVFYAAAYTVGAVVRGMKDRNKAKQYNKAIVDVLSGAEDPKEQRFLITALKNSGLEENIPVVEQYANSEDSGVRRAVARSLTHTQSEEGEKLLMKLARDDEQIVQSGVFNTLESYEMTSELWEELGGLVEDKEIQDKSWGSFVNMIYGQVSPKNADDPNVKRLLDSAIDSGNLPPKQRRRLQELLSKVERRRR